MASKRTHLLILLLPLSSFLACSADQSKTGAPADPSSTSASAPGAGPGGAANASDADVEVERRRVDDYPALW